MNLIVRSKDKLCSTLDFFKDKGGEALSCIISRTIPQPIEVDDDIESFIVTSSAALLSIKQKKLPLFCVGHNTALQAQEMGFRVAYSGAGGAEELAEYITQVFPPQKLLHVAGDVAATDWYEIFTKNGFKISQAIAYKTEFTQKLAENVVSAINSGIIDNILFFSAMGAKTFLELADKQNVDIKNISAIAISEQVASNLHKMTKIKIASQPNMEAMVKLIG